MRGLLVDTLEAEGHAPTVDRFVTSLESHLVECLPEAYAVDVRPAYPDSPSPDAFATDPEADLVQTLAAVSGGAVRPFDAATEASYLAGTAPTVMFGPGVLADEGEPVAHADREYVTRSAVAAAADILRQTLETCLR